MKYNKKIVTAEFISRPNRFNAVVKLNREEITVHVPNTGRCRELLIPGCTVFLREELNPTRKTPYDLVAVYKEDKLISIDSQIPDENEEYFLEVKGVTLEDKGYARFPDAPTERGAKHLLELVEAKKQGYGAGAMFLIQLKDVNKFSPNDERDQEFGKALRFAKENGVDIFAYNCIVTEDRIEINEPVEIIL